MDQLQELYSRHEFLSLARRAGLNLGDQDLAELIRRKLVRPHMLEADGPAGFHDADLYLLARYFDAIKPTRHPWATVPPAWTLADVRDEADRIDDIICGLRQDDAPTDDQISRRRQLGRSLGEYAAQINPFGALAGTLELFKDDVRRQCRGGGLIYVVCADLADQLNGMEPARDVASEDDAASDEAGRVDGVDRCESSDGTASDLGATARSGSNSNGSSFATDTDAIGESERSSVESACREDGDLEITLTDPVEPAEAPQPAPPEEQAADSPNPFEHGDTAVTARTQDLQSRLETLRSRDQAMARERNDESPDPAENRAADSAPGEAADSDMSGRIRRLNRLRERYLAEQRWQKLADLYEDKIDLFADAAERQKVVLTLAMVYEARLDQPVAAFGRFMTAFVAEDVQGSRQKAVEGLERLGRDPSVSEGYLDSLEHELDDEEMTSFYEDLFSHPLPADVLEVAGLRAARHFNDLEELDRAINYYERVLQSDPTQEVAFHSLAQLYEEAGRFAGLVNLYKRKIDRLGDAAPAALHTEFERIKSAANSAAID